MTQPGFASLTPSSSSSPHSSLAAVQRAFSSFREPALSTLSQATRLAFRFLPSSVGIITVRSGPYRPGTALTADMYGMVVSSLTAVCIKPFPAISFNVKRPSSTLDAIYTAAAGDLPFFVNIPGHSPEAVQLATEFAKMEAPPASPPPPSPPTGRESSAETSATAATTTTTTTTPPPHQSARQRREIGRSQRLTPRGTKFDRAARVSPKAKLRTNGVGSYYVSSLVPVVLTCEVMPEKCVQVGDHDVVVARVTRVEYVCDSGPLADEVQEDDGTERRPESGNGDQEYGRVQLADGERQQQRQQQQGSNEDTTAAAIQTEVTPATPAKRRKYDGPVPIPDVSEIIPFQGLLYGNGAFRHWDGMEPRQIAAAGVKSVEYTIKRRPVYYSVRVEDGERD